jgi:2-oxoglutarate ferredoxin oxidoreductase subunit alpha
VIEAAHTLRQQGVKVDLMRVRGFPFNTEVADFLASHEQLFVIEQNRDAQLRALFAIELGVPRDSMTAVLDYGGLPMTAGVVVDAVTQARAEVPA